MNYSKPYNDLPILPPIVDLESKSVLNQAIKANKELARLQGFCSLLPNESILLNSIILKEATASSEIENIITTQDRLYQALVTTQKSIDPSTKEVLSYRSAVWIGFNEIKKNNIITINTIKQIQLELEGNSAGIRTLPGTNLVNDVTGEIIYTPPDNIDAINRLLCNLETYINSSNGIDDLIKMAVIHYQFESIHPFYDGNGRTGRIINVLYLILKGLINYPVIYLSSYIIKNKNAYYSLLQRVRTNNDWESWIIFILKAIESTSIETYELIDSIVNLMNDTIELCKKNLSKSTYSKELIELLFIQPYTKIDFLVKANIAERRTASKYLKELEDIGILKSFKIWKETIFVNQRLYELLKR